MTNFTNAFTLIPVAVVLTGCVHYYSKFNFKGIRNGTASAAAHAVTVDSGEVRDRIHAEELRQADESQRIRQLPRPKPKDSVALEAWSQAYHKLVDLQARAVFLSDLKAMPTFDVSATAQGIIVSQSECRCTLDPSDWRRLVKVRFKLRTERRAVEGWICQDAIEMLHNFDL